MFWRPAQPMEPRAPPPRVLHPRRRPPAQSAASSAHIDHVGADAFVPQERSEDVVGADLSEDTGQLNPSMNGSLLPSLRNDLSVVAIFLQLQGCASLSR